MTARKAIAERRQQLEAELPKAVNSLHVRDIHSRIEELDWVVTILDARSDKSARTAEDHTA
jgi:hypothetical protein